MTWSHDLFLTLITLLPLVFGSVLNETETEKKPNRNRRVEPRFGSVLTELIGTLIISK